MQSGIVAVVSTLLGGFAIFMGLVYVIKVAISEAIGQTLGEINHKLDVIIEELDK